MPVAGRIMLLQPLSCGHPRRALRTVDLKRARFAIFQIPGQDYGHINPPLKRMGIFVAWKRPNKLQ